MSKRERERPLKIFYRESSAQPMQPVITSDLGVTLVLRKNLKLAHVSRGDLHLAFKSEIKVRASPRRMNEVENK